MAKTTKKNTKKLVQVPAHQGVAPAAPAPIRRALDVETFQDIMERAEPAETQFDTDNFVAPTYQGMMFRMIGGMPVLQGGPVFASGDRTRDLQDQAMFARSEALLLRSLANRISHWADVVQMAVEKLQEEQAA